MNCTRNHQQNTKITVLQFMRKRKDLRTLVLYREVRKIYTHSCTMPVIFCQVHKTCPYDYCLYSASIILQLLIARMQLSYALLCSFVIRTSNCSPTKTALYCFAKDTFSSGILHGKHCTCELFFYLIRDQRICASTL